MRDWLNVCEGVYADVRANASVAYVRVGMCTYVLGPVQIFQVGVNTCATVRW